jgi:hypothetical protein
MKSRIVGRQHTMRYDAVVAVLAPCFFVACLGFNLWAVSVGWWHTLLDLHWFRQTYTALATYRMLHGGPWLAYEIPVFGAPWALPLDFPLYQWAVAVTATVLPLPLDQCGRLVSVAFFYLSLPPVYLALREFGVSRAHCCVFLGLWLLSPEYVYWTRTFMIEPAALCCGTWYLAAVGAFARAPQRGRAWLAAGVGTLAALVKLLSFAGFLAAAALLLLRAWRRGALGVRQLVAAGVGMCAVPIAACGVWTAVARSLWAANPLAFSAFDFDVRWHVGPLSLRWDPTFWRAVIDRMVHDTVGHWAVVVACAAALVVSQRRVREALVCLGLFLMVLLVFARGHVIHEYYQYANGLFLVGFVGFAVVSLLERAGVRAALGGVLLAGAAAAQLGSYLHGYYYANQRKDRRLPVADVLRRATVPADVLVVFGALFQWSPEIPYYAQRRALIDWDNRGWDDAAMVAAVKNLNGYRVGAAVFCKGTGRRADLVGGAQAAFTLQRTPSLSASGCDIYLPDSSASRQRSPQ